MPTCAIYETNHVAWAGVVARHDVGEGSSQLRHIFWGDVDASFLKVPSASDERERDFQFVAG